MRAFTLSPLFPQLGAGSTTASSSWDSAAVADVGPLVGASPCRLDTRIRTDRSSGSMMLSGLITLGGVTLRCRPGKTSTRWSRRSSRMLSQPTKASVSADERMREVEGVIADDLNGQVRSEAYNPDLDSEEVDSRGQRYDDVRQRELPRALPFVPEPGYRKFAANVVGDAGFDPLGFCTDLSKFAQYREAEIKHGRLAMFAALGWPLAELYSEAQADEGQIDFLADTGGRFLPQLTGGSGDQFVEIFSTLVLVIGAAAELGGKNEDAGPGDNGFDPLNLKNFSPPDVLLNLVPRPRPWMSEAEVKHSRLAMMVLLYDIVSEVFTQNPVVDNTEYLFHRIDSKFLRPEYWSLTPEDLDVDIVDPVDLIGNFQL